MVGKERIKEVFFFILKVSVFICLWKPLLIIIAVLALVGLVRLFVAGPFVHYSNPIKDQSALKKGDIILTGKASVFSSFYIQVSNVLTRKLKHRFWSHAAIYKGKGKLIEAQPKGIIERNIDDYFKGGYLIRAYRHRYIKDEATLDQIIKKCEEKNGKPYGWVGLGFFTFSSFMPISVNFLFDNWIVDKLCKFDGKYFCSELIVDSFNEVGFPLSPFDGWRVKPSDFVSNPMLKPVNP